MKGIITVKTKGEILKHIRDTYNWKAPKLDTIFQKLNKEEADILMVLFNDAWRKGWKAHEEFEDEQEEIARGNIR